MAFAPEEETTLKDHFCNLDNCAGNPDGGSKEFQFSEDSFGPIEEGESRPFRDADAVAKVVQAAKYLFFPGLKEALYLYDDESEPAAGNGSEDTLVPQTPIYPEAVKAIEKLEVSL